MTIWVNFIGSYRHEGYDLPAYVDVAVRGLIDWPNDGSVYRVRLPKRLFKRTRCYKLGR